MIRKTVLMLALAVAFTSCKESAADKLNEANLVNAEANNSFPVLSFEEKDLTHDFGDLKLNDKAEHVFKFKNTGKADLVIIEAKPSCGCTTPNYTKTPVKPGETGEIQVVYNATSAGAQQKTVTVTSNTSEGTTTLTIKANVKS